MTNCCGCCCSRLAPAHTVIGTPTPLQQMEQFKASNKEWQELEGIAKKPANIASRALCELRDRVAALEAAPDRVLVRNQTGEYLRAGTPLRMDSRFYVDSWALLTSYSMGKARPMEECGKDHAVRYPHSPTTIAECGSPCEQGPEHCDCGQIKPVLATNPSPAKPFVSDKDLFEIQAMAEAGNGAIDTSWEEAKEKFLESFFRALADGRRALFDAGVEWAIREPLAAPGAGTVATDEELREAWELAPAPGGIFNSNHCLRAVYNLGRQHGAPVEQQAPAKPAAKPTPEPAPLPPIRVGQKWRLRNGEVHTVKETEYDRKKGEYTAIIGKFAYRHHKLARFNYLQPNERDLAELVEDAPAPEPAPPAPAGGLVEALAAAIHPDEPGWEPEARAYIKAIAEWLERRSLLPEVGTTFMVYVAYILRQEVNR
jgi:hypothetical protein